MIPDNITIYELLQEVKNEGNVLLSVSADCAQYRL